MRQLEESSDNTGNRELEPGKSFFVDSPIGTADSTDGVSTAGSPGKDVNGGARLRAETKVGMRFSYDVLDIAFTECLFIWPSAFATLTFARGLANSPR